MTTTIEPTNRPVRNPCKGAEYLRSTTASTRGSDSRRKSAAERLEADKWKYVKSAKARQVKATPEPSAGFLCDSAGTHSVGTVTTNSPVPIDHDDRMGDVTNDVRSNGKPSGGKAPKTTRHKMNVPNSDVNTSEMQKQSYVGPSKHKGVQDGRSKTRPHDNRGSRIQSPKGERSRKGISSYLNKAKEGLKVVTSAKGRDDDGANVTNSRQSRSAATKSSRFRSSSVGANQLRATKGAPQKEPSYSADRDEIVLSPRTKLKEARQNLKKVDSSYSERCNNSPAHQRIKTSVVPRPNDENRNKVESANVVKLRSAGIGSSSRPLGRPLSVIENKVTRSVFEASRKDKNETKRDVHLEFMRKKFSTGKDESAPRGLAEPLSSASERLLSSQRLKRRSLDFASLMDNNFQLPQTNVPLPSATQPPLEATPLSSLPQAQPRKSWSRPTPSASDARKNANRSSVHEESFVNRPMVAKMNITEALEEILNPLEDDDMDTAYSSMSPDASMDCKTLVAPNSYGEKNNPIPPDVNGLQHWVKEGEIPSRPKSPDSSRSKTPTADEGFSFGANDVSMTSRESSERWKDSQQSSPESLGRRNNQADKQRHWLKTNDATGTSQPLNRIDLAPGHKVNGGIPNSPMLAPRSRKEVAPDYSKSRGGLLSRSTSREDYVNTMKSQNTSSSASGDINKPLTALTASDLKPRRAQRKGVVHHNVPLKPTYPYPANNHRGSPKRHNNSPVSPTLTPNKQAARMTPPHSSRSTSSTPYSSLKRTPTSSRSSSLKRNRQRAKSDASVFQNELDRFFSTMGMDELASPLPSSRDTLFTTAHVSSESDFSFAGASAYVRDGPDETMEVDPASASLANAPSISIIEKNARVMRWLMACKKTLPPQSSPRPQGTPNSQSYKPSAPQRFPSYPPPVPPRVSSYQVAVAPLAKESDV